MAMEAAVHKRNLESAILFMQQDHATTLKALHEEIHRLQKRCTDLTFQLTMNGISIDEQVDIDSRLQKVQQQLAAAQAREQQLMEQLQERESQLHVVEQEVKSQKKHYLDDIRLATQTISGLRAEVEAKSNNIAYLTTEIHRLKMQHKATIPVSTAQGAENLAHRPNVQLNHLPAPPRELLANSGRVRRGGTHPLTTAGIRRFSGPNSSTSLVNVSFGQNPLESEAQVHALRIGSASSRSGSESPDITPFMQRLSAEMDLLESKKPQPLPPINTQSFASAPAPPADLSPSGTTVSSGLGERNVRIMDSDVRQVLISSNQKSGHRRHRPRVVPHGRPSTPEVTTLAVDQVNSENKNWNRPSESHSSEYN